VQPYIITIRKGMRSMQMPEYFGREKTAGLELLPEFVAVIPRGLARYCEPSAAIETRASS